MPILTLELPDDIYRAARLLSPEERVRRFSKAVTEPEDDEGEYDYDPTVDPVLTEEDMASIGRGIENMKAGRTTSAEVVFARLWKKHGLNPERNPFSPEYKPRHD